MQSTMSPSDTSMDIGDVEQAIMSHQKQTKPEDEDEEVEVLLSPSSPPPPSSTTTTTSPTSTSTIKTSSVIPSSSSSAIATSSNTIEHKIGGVIYEEFKCQHNNFTGLLKVGPLGILFLGKFLLFEWTVIIKWEEVQKVKRKLIGNQKWTAIRIDTSGGSNGNPNPHVYDFESFFDYHKALEVLITLHNDSMLTGAIENNPHNPRMSINQSLLLSSITGGSTGNGSNGNGDLKSSRPLLRRTNSNPSQQISTLFNFDDIPLAATAIAATTTNENNNVDNNEYNRKAMEDLQKQYYCHTNTNETIAAATAAAISASTSGSTTTTTTAAAVTTRTNKIKGGRDEADTTSVISSRRSVMSAATAPAGMSYNVVVGDNSNSKKGSSDNNSVSSSSSSSVCSSPPRRHFMRRDTSMSIATINESGGDDDDTGGDDTGGGNESVVIVDNDNIMVQNEDKEQLKDDVVVSSFNKEQQQQQIRSEWNKAYDEFIQNYTGKGEIAIEDRELQIDSNNGNNGNGSDDDMLELFVNNFINDDADHSMSSFMIDIVHDRDLKVSKWVIETNEIETEDDSGDASGSSGAGGDQQQQQQQPQIYKRIIEYTHPVNAPMAPPQAKAKKEQILKKYHNCGIIIETKTFVSDVPMTDFFYVTDTICISLPTSSSDDDDDDKTNQKRCKLILNIRFDIVFVKSTYFRSLIYCTTKNEMQQFMMNFTEYIIAKLAVLPPSLKGISTTKKATTNETDYSTSAAAIINPITTKEIISSSSSSSNQPARGVASSSKIAATITTNDNNSSNNWNWWWKILSFILLILIAKFQIQILNEIKSIRIEIQQQREQQQQVPEQCKLNNVE
ncbi:putative chitinase [Fragilariopsis cylindrus CCMP1102]|uniref:Putative chitinase n=1 Tax=Fragilariopsis cylindrus CCMP1102 TaxID=635003 RepID=A0A1E7FIK2_9STRA|nr:putative chitinase [Fragilariopsis cylindrus CCMP1102]|eukprot:OEU17988.1 putative chitinase [Fragilariopsis cylindrus CCMP1102]